MDYFILANLAICFAWTIPYLMWQCDRIHAKEQTWTWIIRFADLVETIMLVLTRFVPYGFYGTIALAAFYIVQVIMLVLQFVFADWGALARVKSFLWILFYIFFFLVDIVHVDLLQYLINAPFMVSISESIKGISIDATVIELIIMLIKLIIALLTRTKKKEEEN